MSHCHSKKDRVNPEVTLLIPPPPPPKRKKNTTHLQQLTVHCKLWLQILLFQISSNGGAEVAGQAGVQVFLLHNTVVSCVLVSSSRSAAETASGFLLVQTIGQDFSQSRWSDAELKHVLWRCEHVRRVAAKDHPPSGETQLHSWLTGHVMTRSYCCRANANTHTRAESTTRNRLIHTSSGQAGFQWEDTARWKKPPRQLVTADKDCFWYRLWKTDCTAFQHFV